MTHDLFYMIVITYSFVIIALLLNIFYHKFTFKKSIYSTILQIIVMNSAILFIVSDTIEPRVLVLWQIPVLLLLFVSSQFVDIEELNIFKETQNRIVLGIIFVYIVMDILKFNNYIKNFLYFVAFALAELFVFGILQKLYKYIKDKIEEEKKTREEDESLYEEDEEVESDAMDFKVNEKAIIEDDLEQETKTEKAKSEAEGKEDIDKKVEDDEVTDDDKKSEEDGENEKKEDEKTEEK